MKHIARFFAVIVIIVSFPMQSLSHTGDSFALVHSNLENEIIKKANDLKAIGEQIQDTEKQIDDAQGQKKTLSNEITSLNAQGRQVNLGIRLSEINIQKLGLEIDSLQYKIGDTEKSIGDMRGGIKKTFQSIQERDDKGFFMLFLKNATLADGMVEMQNLLDLNNNLIVEAEELKLLKATLGEQLQNRAQKKTSVKRENENLKTRRIFLSDVQKSKNQLLSETKNKESAYQKQLSDLEKKREEIAAEIEAMEAELRLMIDPARLPIPRHGVLAFPVPDGRITQDYGRTTFALVNYRGKHHNGIDIGRFLGAEIIAAESGIVVGLGNQDKYCRGGAYGKYIVIRHDNNLTTLYAHLSRQVVSVGGRVERGQIIGYMGRTGWSTGPHLHFTVYDSATYIVRQSRVCGPMPIGGDINPMQYIERI